MTSIKPSPTAPRAKPRKKPTPYNGHPNWRLWNVSMWLGADHELYRLCDEILRQNTKDDAALIIHHHIGHRTTPDGARFTKSAIRYALRHWG